MFEMFRKPVQQHRPEYGPDDPVPAIVDAKADVSAASNAFQSALSGRWEEFTAANPRPPLDAYSSPFEIAHVALTEFDYDQPQGQSSY